MKNNSIKSCICLLISIVLWSCEKDDICAESTITTPRLVVAFYDSTTTDSAITLSSVGYNEVSTNVSVVQSSVSQILLPLKTDEDSVSFELTLYGDDEESSSDDFTDTITIAYTRKDIYISRACGYKTNFTLTDFSINSTNWLSNSYALLETSITNEDEVHLKLYY